MAKIMPAHVPVHIEPEVILPAQAEPPAAAAEVKAASAPAVDHYVDTYVARSVKSSPNGF